MTSDNRRCATCDQLLSRYNTGTICAACQTNRRTIIATGHVHIPPPFWLRPDVRAALSQWDWATVFGAVMTETGASQTQLAQAVGLSQAHVSRLASGASQCFDVRTITQIVDGLGAPRILAGLAPPTTVRADSLRDEQVEEADPMKRRTFLASPLAASLASAIPAARTHVTLDEARMIRHVVPQLYTLDDQAGGDLVTDLTTQCLRRVDHILHTAEYAEDTGHELLCASGELAEMAGWMHFDNGHYHDARLHFGDALRTAQLADDLNLEVLVLASMNMLARYQNRPREALQVIHLAQRRAAGWATPRLDALLAAREAACRAQLGDATGSTRAMQRALHLFQPVATADDPNWITYFTTAELAATRASAAGYLGDSTNAARHMRTAVDGLEPTSQRNKAYYSVRLGQYALAAGDLTTAVNAVTPVLPLFTDVRSRRAHRHLAQFVSAVDVRTPAARQFVDQARALDLMGTSA